MMELTIHTGLMGDCNTINIDWLDERGIHNLTRIEVNVLNQDRPRTLILKLNGAIIATIPRPA